VWYNNSSHFRSSLPGGRKSGQSVWVFKTEENKNKTKQNKKRNYGVTQHELNPHCFISGSSNQAQTKKKKATISVARPPGEYYLLTCATRPFQISAFFFNPNGPWPSLKFHCLSNNRVLLLTLLLLLLLLAGEEVVAWIVLPRESADDVCGVTKALQQVLPPATVRHRTIATSNEMDLIMIIFKNIISWLQNKWYGNQVNSVS